MGQPLRVACETLAKKLGKTFLNAWEIYSGKLSLASQRNLGKALKIDHGSLRKRFEKSSPRSLGEALQKKLVKPVQDTRKSVFKKSVKVSHGAAL